MRTRFSPGSAFLCGLLVRERQLVQENGVGRLRAIAIHLIVHRDSIPARRGAGTVVTVHVAGHSVQSNCLVEQLVIGGALPVDRHMIPRVVIRIAGNPGCHPVLIDVVPDIPFVAAGDSALLSPDKTQAVEKLIEIKFQRLRAIKLAAKKVDIVGEVVKGRNDGVV
jgi:hypothetical protein